MKNKLFCIIISLVFLLLPLKIMAADNDTFIDWELDRNVFVHQERNGEDYVTNLAIITANGVIAYCIEPGVLADKASYYNSTLDVSQTPLGSIDTKYISLVGYYGYKYPSHDDKRYYMAAQELIWEHMGVDNVWFSDAKYGGNVIDVSREKKVILNLVNNYETPPKFNFKDDYIVGDEIELDDANNVLKDYDVTNPNTLVEKENNTIKIKVNEGDNTFTLSRKNGDSKIRFYYKSGYQTIGSFEAGYNYSSDYLVRGDYGKIIVDKIDKDTNSKTPSSSYASLKGAVYAVYDASGKLLQTKETNEDGMIVFDRLPKGNYSIKEIKASEGYTVSKTISRTFLASSQMSITITFDEKIIENKIIITKVLEISDGSYAPEQNITFGVFDDKENLIGTYQTNEEGKIEIVLPYGKYVIKQMDTMPGVDKVKDTLITVDTDGLLNEITLVNHKLPEPTVPKLPKTGKSSFIIFVAILNVLSMIGLFYEKKVN